MVEVPCGGLADTLKKAQKGAGVLEFEVVVTVKYLFCFLACGLVDVQQCCFPVGCGDPSLPVDVVDFTSMPRVDVVVHASDFAAEHRAILHNANLLVFDE